MTTYYFCLYQDLTTSWERELSEEQQSKIQWSKSYNYKKWDATINFVSFHRSGDSYKFEYQGSIKNLSLIKSNTQKTYRRCETQNCLASFKLLCALNINSALKRLMIIILEDSVYTSMCDTLIWLQICSSYFNYTLNKSQWEYIFKLIYFYCEIYQYQLIPFDVNKLWNKKEFTNGFKPTELWDYSNRNNLLSLLLYNDRNKFMLAGDKVLGYFTIEQIKGLSGFSYDINSINCDLNKIAYLSYSDINIVACDFHCDPTLIKLLQTSFPGVADEQTLKSCIWYMSSRINKRQHLNLVTNEVKEFLEYEQLILDKYSSLWLKIRETCYRIMLSRVLMLYPTANRY